MREFRTYGSVRGGSVMGVPTAIQKASSSVLAKLLRLRREQLDLQQGLLHVRRRKNGLPSTQSLARAGTPGVAQAAPRRSGHGLCLRLRAPRADDHGYLPQALSPAPATRPGWACRSIRTCSAIRQASSSPTTARIPAPSSTTSGTRTFSTPSSTHSLPSIASTTSGKTERPRHGLKNRSSR